jgi:hypothetical protein
MIVSQYLHRDNRRSDMVRQDCSITLHRSSDEQTRTRLPTCDHIANTTQAVQPVHGGSETTPTVRDYRIVTSQLDTKIMFLCFI